jgi:hypothetical protein
MRIGMDMLRDLIIDAEIIVNSLTQCQPAGICILQNGDEQL